MLMTFAVVYNSRTLYNASVTGIYAYVDGVYMDGSGWIPPEGYEPVSRILYTAAEEDIPEEARIIAVAHAYDAMTSRRSYRDEMPQEKVRSEIEKGSGKQYDPRFARIMIALIGEDRTCSMREK